MGIPVKKIITFSTLSCSLFCVCGNCSIVSFEDPKTFEGVNELNNLKGIRISNTSTNVSSFTMKSYFQNLYQNSPMNSNGSCGFVSLIQYLSYFDTFVNDDYIPSVYEWSGPKASSISQAITVSPGVLRQSYPSTNLFSWIQQNYEDDFQAYLFYINYVYNNKMTNPQIIGMWDYQTILNYLYGNYVFNFEYVRWPGGYENIFTQTLYKNKIKEYLDSGYPAIVHISDGNSGGFNHSIVAYYHDNLGIHANFGWGENDTDVVFDNDYYIYAVGAIKTSNHFSHSHSNNYYINDLQYCGCGYHVHKFKNSLYYDEQLHLLTCSCGEVSVEEHSINWNLIQNDDEYAKCLVCGGDAKISLLNN